MLLLLPLLLITSATATAKHSDSNPGNNALHYAPKRVSCTGTGGPGTVPLLLRPANGELSPREQQWLAQRDAVTAPWLRGFLRRATAQFDGGDEFLEALGLSGDVLPLGAGDSDGASVLPSREGEGEGASVLPSREGDSEHPPALPRVALAFSGGGYRSMLTGAGVVAAMDARTPNASVHGLGGLLQAASHVAGVSGGNWLVGSLAWNNWTAVSDILGGWDKGEAEAEAEAETEGDSDSESDSEENDSDGDGPIWDLHDSIISPGGMNIFKSARRWDRISNAVQAKQDAGFETSLTDVWGRALSYNFFPQLERGGIGYTWSSLRDSETFRNAQMPFPISISDGRYPGSSVINLNATLFEFNPFEMGSWDPTLNAFFDVKYLGTNVSNGQPLDHSSSSPDHYECVTGYDNTAFIMATSSTLFNQFLLRINSTKLPVPKFITRLATHFLNDLSQDYNDIAVYHPNPFRGSNYVRENYTDSIASADSLYLVDGGEDDENIPFLPLVQQSRGIDVIFAVDSSADMKLQWPDGSSLVHTYERQFFKQGNFTAFPYIPDTNTFVNLGLNKRPTFFGCDASNMTDLKYIPPVVVYLPNTEYSFQSNQSAFKLSYSEEQRRGMIRNGYEMATRNNFTDDPDFLSCVGCAIVRRQQERLNISLPIECESCFLTYCWDGSLDTTELPDMQKDWHHSFVYENGAPNDTATNGTGTKASGAFASLQHSDSPYLRDSNSRGIPDEADDSHFQNTRIYRGTLINIKFLMLLLCILTFLVGLI